MTEWKLVPVEPDAAMVRAGQHALMDRDYSGAVFKAMLAAAPPAPSAEPVVTDAMVEAAHSYVRSELRGVSLPDEYMRGILRAALERKR